MQGEVTIRFIEPNDALFVQKYASNIEISKTCNVPHPYPENGGEGWTKFVISRRKEGISYAFAILYNGHFSGVITLNAVNHDNKTAELDYWVAYEYWGKGVGTAAASKAIEYAFRELGLHTLKSGCLVKKPASGRILEKNGFTPFDEGTFSDGKFKGQRFIRYILKK
jgi:RimJ/RimL family protein N-acetyltransferase